MSVIPNAPARTLRWARERASAEHGFTMVAALGVLLVTSLLLTAMFYAVSGEIHVGTDNLAAKRAYAAASAGVQAYLYQMNQNPNYWETCANDTQATAVTVPGSSDNASYTFQPIWANGNTGCTSNVINSLVDNTTGSIRLVFTGSAGGRPVVNRAIVVSFRMDSPLDFLWYTHFEAVDDGIPGFSSCGVFYRSGRNSSCNIVWISGDTMNGPAYTDDQYLINSGASPTFGRSASDKIESSAPGTSAADVCSGSNCQNAVFKGTPVYNAKPIPTPSDNSELLTDAQQYGNVFNGTTSVVLNGTSATVTTCTSSSTGSCTSKTISSLVAQPIIYVNNASGCTPAAYTPFGATYPANSTGYYGCAGDVYVSGNYTTPVTIGAANNVIIAGNLTTTADGSGNPTGSATLGLVANEFVRVMHGINGSDSSSGCSTTNNSSQTLTNPTIDAAILALNHSFIVDNYNCGASPGTLNVHGAIAQYFRGPVGVASSGGGAQDGYIKNYNYDDRLANILPPYLFDISDSGWHISRETLCTPPGTGSNSTSTCQ
jgi:type II secretory pathway pseudopilin PulG